MCAATGDEARVPRVRREARENGSVRFLVRPTTSELTSGVARFRPREIPTRHKNTASADDRKPHSVRNHSGMTFKKSRNVNDARIGKEFQSITLLASDSSSTKYTGIDQVYVNVNVHGDDRALITLLLYFREKISARIPLFRRRIANHLNDAHTYINRRDNNYTFYETNNL